MRRFVLEVPQHGPPAACVFELLAVLDFAVVESVSLCKPALSLVRVMGVLPVLLQQSSSAALLLAEPAVPFVLDRSACVFMSR